MNKRGGIIGWTFGVVLVFFLIFMWKYQFFGPTFDFIKCLGENKFGMECFGIK